MLGLRRLNFINLFGINDCKDSAFNYCSPRLSEFVPLRAILTLATVMPVISAPIGFLIDVPPFYRCTDVILYRGGKLSFAILPIP